MTKKTIPVATIDGTIGRSVLNRYGNKGTNPQTTNALNVLAAAIQGERAE